MITLANEGLLGDRPVLLNGDGAGQPASGSVVMDSLRRRVVNFGEIRGNYSPTLTAGQPADTFLSTDDYAEPGLERVPGRHGVHRHQNVTASSSDSDITASPAQWATGTLPYAAFDGNTATTWESGAFDGPLGQWIQADFDSDLQFWQAGRPSSEGTIQVAFADNPAIGPPVTKVTREHRGRPDHRLCGSRKPPAPARAGGGTTGSASRSPAWTRPRRSRCSGRTGRHRQRRRARGTAKRRSSRRRSPR